MPYDEVSASGQVIDVGSGETYENKLIDLSTGGSFRINAAGGGATIRNIGYSGLYTGGNFVITITAGSGEVLFENIYIGDGANKSGESFQHGPGAVFYHNSSSANVTFRRMNVQGYPNNGFYCSNSASGGTITWENCLAANNGVSSYRCADPGDRIINCVAYNDNTDYGPGYGGYSETDGRPVWVWSPGGMTITDSHFDSGSRPNALTVDRGQGANMEGGAYSGGVLGNLNESGVGSSPNLSPPEGVPMSAEAAANGEGGASAPDTNNLEVSTSEATNVTSSGATLNGAVDDLGDNDSVDVWFQYRQA